MKSIKWLLILVFAAIAPNMVSAQKQDTTRWIEVFDGKEFHVTLDTKTLKKGKVKNTLLAWTRWSYYKPQTPSEGKIFKSVLDEDQINCEENLSGAVSTMRYDSTGNVVLSHKFSVVSMESIIPESVQEVVVEKICDYWKNKNSVPAKQKSKK